MELDKALDRLTALKKRLACVWFADDDDKHAVNLGIEALNRVKAFHFDLSSKAFVHSLILKVAKKVSTWYNYYQVRQRLKRRTKVNFRLQIKWLPHPTDTKDYEETLEAETMDELMLKFADFLRENMFAEWGYYHNIYYPDIRSTVSYLGQRRTIGVH